MSRPNADEREVLLALENSGMEAELIEQVMECLRTGKSEKGNRILSSHRAKLLSDVHAEQEKLYCMDFICRKLKREKGPNRKEGAD